MKRLKEKNIVSSISHSTVSLLGSVILFFSLGCLSFIYFTSAKMMDLGGSNAVNGSARLIESEINVYKQICHGIGILPELSDPNLSTDEKENILENTPHEFGFINCILIDTNGYIEKADVFAKDRKYFQEALNGNITISNPLISRKSGELVFIVAGPVWKDGIPNSEVVSVAACSFSPDILHYLITHLNLSRHSTAKIIGENGLTIASFNEKEVYSLRSVFREAIKNPRLKKRAEIEKNALYDTKRIQKMWVGLTHKSFYSMPISDTPGWVLITEVPYKDYETIFYAAISIFLIFGSIIIFFCSKFTKKISQKVSDSVMNAAERLKKAAVGDFTSSVYQDESLEEVKLISECTQKLVDRMYQVLDETTSISRAAKAFSIIEVDKYNDLNSLIEDTLNISLALYDLNGKRILGTDFIERSGSFSSNIYINNKVAGKFIVSIKNECLLESNDIEALLKTLSDFVGRIMETVIRREEQYQACKQNAKINMNVIIDGYQSVADELDNIIKDTLNDFTQEQRTKIEKIISYINESTEYNKFNGVNYQISECDYKLNHMIKNISDSATAVSNNISVAQSNSLPEKLFGDMDSIERMSKRVLKALAEVSPDSIIKANFECLKKGMGANLKISFVMEEPLLAEDEINKLKFISLQGKSSENQLNHFEQKMVSAFRLANSLNGNILVESFPNSILCISISIPQLIVTGE